MRLSHYIANLYCIVFSIRGLIIKTILKKL